MHYRLLRIICSVYVLGLRLHNCSDWFLWLFKPSHFWMLNHIFVRNNDSRDLIIPKTYYIHLNFSSVISSEYLIVVVFVWTSPKSWLTSRYIRRIDVSQNNCLTVITYCLWPNNTWIHSLICLILYLHPTVTSIHYHAIKLFHGHEQIISSLQRKLIFYSSYSRR